MTLLQQIEEIFQLVVQYGVLLLECAGVAVLLVTAVKSMAGCVKHRPHIRLWNSSWAARCCGPCWSGR